MTDPTRRENPHPQDTLAHAMWECAWALHDLGAEVIAAVTTRGGRGDERG